MTREELNIGDRFKCNGGLWQVTDIGTRTVIAVPVKEGWLDGPPYAVQEIVFDEEDMPVCEVQPYTGV